MEANVNAQDLARVMVFFLASGVLISCFTELMLDRIERLRERSDGDGDFWESQAKRYPPRLR